MQKFNKSLSQMDVFCIALGAIIGWGCFVLPGNSFLPKAGPMGTVVGLVVGATMIMVISSSYSYLVEIYPALGGEYVYAKENFGNGHAFICGWALILAYTSLVPLNGTALAMISRYLFPGIIQIGKMYSVAGWDIYIGEVILASLFISIMAVVNIKGIKQAGGFQFFVTLLLIISIISVTILVFLFGNIEVKNLVPLFQEDNYKWYYGVFMIIAMTPWAFIGFDCIPQISEECRFSHNKIRTIMFVSIACACILYICINTITAIVIPWKELLNQKPFWATGMVIDLVLGKGGLFLIGISMLCAVIAGMNAFYMTSSRLIYFLSLEKVLPNFLGTFDGTNKTPKNAICFVWFISLIAPWFGREVLGWIVDMTSLGTAISFFYTTISAAKVAKKQKNGKQYFVGLLGSLCSLLFLLLLILPFSPAVLSMQSIVCLAIWISIGAVFWLIHLKQKRFMSENWFYKYGKEGVILMKVLSGIKSSLSQYKRRLLCRVNIEKAVMKIYSGNFNEPLNLENPKRFQEKLQYLKLRTYYNNPTITMCVDKYRVREYVKNKLGNMNITGGGY